MNILLIDNGTRRLGRLKDLLTGNKITIVKLLGEIPDTGKFDLIILSGGSQFSVEGAPEIFRDEIQLIRTTSTPIIGICEGCQLIAFAFGSELEFKNKKSKGFRRIIPLKNSPIFEDREYLEVYESHHWAITKLGNKLTALAKSNSGYEVIKHKTRKIYGAQFHPEMYTEKSSGDEVFVRILSKIKEAGVKQET